MVGCTKWHKMPISIQSCFKIHDYVLYCVLCSMILKTVRANSWVRNNMKTLDLFFNSRSHYIYYQHHYFSKEWKWKNYGFFCSRWYLIIESCQKSLWHSDSDSPHGVQTEVVVVAETDRQMKWWSCKREPYITRLAARCSTDSWVVTAL